MRSLLSHSASSPVSSTNTSSSDAARRIASGGTAPLAAFSEPTIAIAGPAVAIVGSENATDGAIPPEAIRRAATLEDVFVLLTGEEAE